MKKYDQNMVNELKRVAIKRKLYPKPGKRDRIETNLVFFAFYLVVCFLPSILFAGEFDIVIIGNKTVPFQAIEKSELIKAFTFEKKNWDEKTPIQIVLLRGGDTHQKFTNEYLDMKQEVYRRLCIRSLRKSEQISPVIFKSENSILKHVKITKGAIGYISSRIKPKGVKTIKIIKNHPLKFQ